MRYQKFLAPLPIMMLVSPFMQLWEDATPAHPEESSDDNFDWDSSCWDSNLSTLISWAELNGALLHDIEVQAHYGMRGVFATSFLAPGFKIAHIPDRLVFGVDKLMDSPLSHALHETELIDKNRLILFLLHERALGRTSFWHEYICSLPRRFDTPLWWNDTRIAALSLDPSRADLYDYTEYLRDRLHRAWADIVPPLARRHPGLFAHPAFGYRAWLWAWSVVNSRNFRVSGRRPGSPDTNVLLPVADMFNHRRGDNGTLARELGGGSSGFAVRSGPGRAAGEEVFLSYGEGVRRRRTSRIGEGVGERRNDDGDVWGQ